MKYVSIDLETTGLDHRHCSIVEIGAVIDDLNNQKPLGELPRFHAYVKEEIYTGEPFALSMHSTIFRRIADQTEGYQYLWPNKVGLELRQFFTDNGIEMPVNVAGKNFASFDARFLEKLEEFDTYVQFHHRVIDPTMLYWHPHDDSALPGTNECMKRAGLRGVVAHTALEDALIVVDLVRRGICPIH